MDAIVRMVASCHGGRSVTDNCQSGGQQSDMDATVIV